MNTHILLRLRTQLPVLGLILALMAAAVPAPASAAVLPASTCSETGGVRSCDLWAKAGTLALPGSVTVNIWGYAPSSSDPAGLPGPTLIANSGETLEVTLHNDLLGEITSLSIPGLPGKSDTVGVAPSDEKTYTYPSLQPGTYIYQAGPTSNGERQVAMGLYGVLIVRPAGFPLQAYGSDSTFDDEAVIVMSEIDTLLNASPTTYDMRNYTPRYFLFNGKAYPNTDNIDTAAGNDVLLRLVNAGIQSRSLGVLGLRYSVLSMDGKPLTRPHSAVAETLGAGQTADVLVSIPAGAALNQKYAVYDTSLRLLNNSSRFGGMLTFLNVTTGTGGGPGDTTGPSASALLLSPNPSNGLANVTFTATVSDAAAGGSVVDGAEYFIDTLGTYGTGIVMSGAFTSDTVAVTETLTVAELAALSSGSHNIFLHGHDAAGNWGPFTSIALVLDKTGPSTTGLSASPNPTNGSVAVALSASASDNASGNSNVVAAEYFLGATGADGSGTSLTLNQVGPSVALTGTISAVDMGLLAEGYHTVSVHSRDSLGNWGAFVTMQLGVDKSGPATSGVLLRVNPNNGALPYSPSIQSVRLDATFTEPGGGPVTSTISNAEFFLDTACVNGTGVLMTPNDGSYNSATENGYSYIALINISTLSEGPHTFRVHGRDATGNWGACAVGTLNIDKTAPTVSGLVLTPSASNNSAVGLSASANDSATGNSNIAAGEFFIDTAGAAGTGTAMTAASASPATSITGSIPGSTIAALTAGNHTIYVRAKDVAGNWSTTTSAVLLIDRTAPTQTGISLVPNSIVTGTASITLNVNGAVDPLVGGLASGLNGGEYWFGTTNPAPGGGTAFSGLSTSIPTGTLTPGTYTVRARLRDAAGNWGAFNSATLTVTPPPLYFSTAGNTNPPGLGGTADDSDIYFWNGSSFSRNIDLSAAPYNVTAGNNVDEFDRVDATHFYVSFTTTVTLPGSVTVDDEDIAYYNAGTWSIYFNGGTNGLGGTLPATSFDLDAFSIVGAGGPGNIYFSTDNNNVPPGAGGTGDDGDIYRWNGGSSYTRVVDVSAVAYGVPGTANVDGLKFVDATHFYLSFSNDGGVTLPVLGSVQDEDVVYYNAGVWSIYFDGSNAGAGLHTSNNLDIDAFDLP